MRQLTLEGSPTWSWTSYCRLDSAVSPWPLASWWAPSAPHRLALAGGGFTPGSVGIGDPYVPGEGNGGYQVRSYDLDLRFNPATDTLRGTATIEATATQDLSAFNLDLYGLTVQDASVDGVSAGFSTTPRELTVQPVTGIPSGQRFTAYVEYRGQPEILNDPDLGKSGWFNTSDGAIVVGEPEAGMFWFPVNEHPSDKARMCTEISVPKGLRAVSTGLPERRPVTRHGWTTFRWCTRDPMASYLSTVAIGTWRFDRSRTDSGIPVLNYVDRTLARSVDRALGRTAEIVDFFAKRFGDYPFESAGGIADNHVSYYALENQTRPTYDKKTVALARAPGHGRSRDSPTSGTGTASRSSAGGTSGSTRASPPTESGSGRSTSAERPSNRASTRSTPCPSPQLVLDAEHLRPRVREPVRQPDLLPRCDGAACAGAQGRGAGLRADPAGLGGPSRERERADQRLHQAVRAGVRTRLGPPLHRLARGRCETRRPALGSSALSSADPPGVHRHRTHGRWVILR